MEFTSELHKMYKYANDVESPIKYVYINDKGNMTDVFEYIKEHSDMKMNDIYVFLSSILDISLIECIMIYWLIKYTAIITEIPSELIDQFEEYKNRSDNPDLKIYIDQYQTDLQDYLNQINILMENYEYPIYESISMFDESYTEFLDDLKKNIEQMQQKYTRIKSDEEILSKTTPLKHTEPNITSIIYKFRPKWSNLTDILPEDGLDIFTSISPNENIPYIQYNDETGNQKVMVYEKTKDPQALYKIITQVTYSSRENIFIFILRDPDLSQLNYITAIYSLTTGELRIPATIDKISIYAQLLSIILISINIGPPEEYRLRGSFEIENININDASFYYIINTNPLISTYLMIDESETTWATRDHFNIHYLSQIRRYNDDDQSMSSSVNIYFSNITSDDIDIESFKLDTSKRLHIEIVKAESQKVLKEFIEFFTRLLNIYTEERERTEDMLKVLIPKICKIPTGKPGHLTDVKSSKNKQLRSKFEDVFVRGYAEKCQCSKQPIIIDDDEIDEWRANKIGGTIDRQVFPFPPTDPKLNVKPMFHFVCPNETSPYPYYMNSSLSNKAKYPYIPCCITTDHQFDKVKIHNYEDYEHKVTSKLSYRIKTDRYIDLGRVGELPLKLYEVLNNCYNSTIEDTDDTAKLDFVRLGVPITPNSLIHCVFIAVNDSGYVAANDKELYVTNFRKNILPKNIDPSAYKQEMYDFNLEKIEELVKNPEVFFDPFLFYRGLELYFNINIYVFNPTGPVNPIFGINDNETEPCFEVPRCKYLHIRPPFEESDKKTVIILKHAGNDQNKPHCELIISNGRFIDDCCDKKERNRINETIHIFENSMNQTLDNMLRKTLSDTLFTFSSLYSEARSSPYSKIDWTTINNLDIVEQNIDEYGKADIINARINGEIITLYIPPTQPFNVKQMTILYSINYQHCLYLFGEPISRTQYGVWYSVIDFDDGVFIPINDEIPTHIKVSNTPPPTINTNISDQFNQINKIKSIKRQANILIQLIEWLWRLDKCKTIEVWWDEMVKVVEIEPASPNFNALTCRLPPATDAKSGLHELYKKKWWEAIFNTKITLNSKLSNKLLAYFKRRSVQLESLTPEQLKPSFYLKNIYTTSYDFPQKENTVIFTDLKHLYIWMDHQNNTYNLSTSVLPINTEIDLSKASYQKPFIFKKIDILRRGNIFNRFFIVQNVFKDDFARAANVAIKWERDGVNIGFNSPKLDLIKYTFPYVIYGIDKTNTLFPIFKNINSDYPRNYYEFISYDGNTNVTTGRFGALLQIS